MTGSSLDGPSLDARVLSDQREANTMLVLAGLRAHEEAELRERLIGILGHDLRNPLNAILMAAGLIVANGDLTEEDEHLAALIIRSGGRMSRMIAQLLAFTRARIGGGFALTLAKGDLADLCCAVADELRVGAPADVVTTTTGPLPGEWDCDRLAEALSNVARNAVDHATPGTTVRLRAYEDGEAAVAEISNEGAAIPSELQRVLFEPFRGVETRSKPGHLGLGLYISHEVARAHGGTLTFRCAAGTTTFVFRLPKIAPPSL